MPRLPGGVLASFLSTQDNIAPGNYGLKDVVLALKWVKKNIIKFGGDGNKITVFGESAGAAMIGYMLISRQSRNLFHAAIMESGTPLCPWALHRNARKVAFDLGVALGLTTNSSSTLIRFLQSQDLLKSSSHMIRVNLLNFIEVFDNGGPFGPVIEPESNQAFLTKGSFRAFQKGDFQRIPVIVGMNSQEIKGVAHATELWYLWKAGWTKQTFQNTEEELTSERLVKLWTNFATYGKLIARCVPIYNVITIYKALD
ncbi:hypothetical protein YQE_03122, partial [Dendroctonus ponderosae]